MRQIAIRPGFAVILAAILGLGACRSVYDSAQNQLPPDLQLRLNARVSTARDAAASGLATLEPVPSAPDADAAGWDLDRAAASIGDVIDRMPERDADAMAVQREMERAAASLTAAADSLTSSGGSRTSDAVDRAKAMLHAAIDRADEFLARDTPEPR